MPGDAMTYYSLFSGIEAASVAWEPLGWRPLCLSELAAFPNAVLAARLPGVPNAGDITRVDWDKVVGECGRPDVVIGGSPCQSFSLAGSREGLHGESGLMWEYLRAIQGVRPRWAIWENVPGALSSEHGRAFGQLLHTLDELGYDVAWRVLDASLFGVPQRRRRLFVVAASRAAFGDDAVERAATVLLPEGDLRQDSEAMARGGMEAEGRPPAGRHRDELLLDHRGRRWPDVTVTGIGDPRPHMGVMDEVLPTLTARRNLSVQGIMVRWFDHETGEEEFLLRRITPVEAERGQGFPDGWTDLTGMDPEPLLDAMFAGPYSDMRRDSPEGRKVAASVRRWCRETPRGVRYEACGNSMAVPVIRWLGERISLADGLAA